MQELGETRVAMTKGLMGHVEKAINGCNWEKFYILVHAKPFPHLPTMIKQKILLMRMKPSMMLSCMLFSVDKKEGKLMLEWALPGDWPTWAAEGRNEPVPEVIASYDRMDKRLTMSPCSSMFEMDGLLAPV